MLTITTKDHPFDWEDPLPKVCMAYNSSVHASTRYSPFFLVFGQRVKTPVDLVCRTGGQDKLPVPDYALQLSKGLEEVYQNVRMKLTASHVHHKITWKTISRGRICLATLDSGPICKLHHLWTGPFKIMELLTECDY